MEYRFCLDGVWQTSERNILQILSRLEEARFGLIVGPHGSGKTTLLYSLGPWLDGRFVDTRHLQLQASPSRALLARRRHARRAAKTVSSEQSRLCDGGLMIVDGMEQLRRIDRARLFRRVARRRQRLLATSHMPLGGMTIVYQTHVNSRLAPSLAQSLLAGASPELVDLVDHELGQRDLSKLTNVRELWFELYDSAQTHIQSDSLAAR